ncbi:hypothetical protein ACC743_39120, partial [Rhizobium ruizarguesonis]
ERCGSAATAECRAGGPASGRRPAFPTGRAPVQNAALPVVVADPAEIARISDSINISDRAGISVYGERAQQAVSDYADRILREV